MKAKYEVCEVNVFHDMKLFKALLFPRATKTLSLYKVWKNFSLERLICYSPRSPQSVRVYLWKKCLLCGETIDFSTYTHFTRFHNTHEISNTSNFICDVCNKNIGAFQSPSVSDDANRGRRKVREVELEEDQDAAASGGNGPEPADDLSDAEDADRDKRYLPFGGDVHVSAGGGGGSGNFLFDLIRVSSF